ncbi:hypothetical protein ACFWPK_27010 [Nocardia sp. NPDC058519]|uniref:hypothetical protein n=1 Tax=Nocardia sp. NPDC058519 TaxID=3346535 RepID=UPI0036467D6B
MNSDEVGPLIEPAAPWVADRSALLAALSKKIAAPSRHSERGAGGRVQEFHGMTAASAARMVERVYNRNQLISSATIASVSEGPTLTASPIAGIAPTGPRNNVDPGIYAQPAQPHDNADPGIVAPGEPDISHRNPDEPNDALYRTGPDPGSQRPGSGGAGNVPYAGGNSGNGGSGGGGNTQGGPDDGPGTSVPAPQRNSIENPPGRKLLWNNDEPYWDDGTPVDIWRTYENGQERVHYGYPVPIPGSEDDAYPVPAPGSDRVVPEPGTTEDPSRGNSPSDQPSSPRGTESSPTQEEDRNPDGPHNDAGAPAAAAGTESGEGGGFSPLSPNPDAPPMRVPPPPEPLPEPGPEPTEAEQSLLDQFLRELSEYISTDPSFLESLIPLWGPLRQAIADGLAGDWTGFAANLGFFVLDITGIGALGRIGAKILAKPFSILAPRIVEGIGKGLDDIAKIAREAMERAGRMWPRKTSPRRVPGGGEEWAAPLGKGPFPNQMADRLERELAQADAAGIRPLRPSDDGFDEIINSGERIKWALTMDGDLLVLPHDIAGYGEIPHSVLTRGASVMAAGEAQIAGSRASGYYGLEITPHSGHFQPSLESLGLGREAFSRYGISFF